VFSMYPKVSILVAALDAPVAAVVLVAAVEW